MAGIAQKSAYGALNFCSEARKKMVRGSKKRATHPHFLLNFDSPEAVATTIFIDRQGSMLANRKENIAVRSTIKPHSTALELNKDKHLLATISHAAAIGTRHDAQATILKKRNLGEVLASIAIDNIGFEPLHRLAAADNGDIGVDELDNDIATNGALIKNYVHSVKVLVLPHYSKI